MNIGILLNNLSSNQEAFLTITQGNAINLESTEHNIELYYKDCHPTVVRYAGLSTSLDKALHCNSYLVATNLNLAQFVLNSYSDKPKFLYLSEIEWFHGSNNYLANLAVLQNPDLHIIVPSFEYADELKNYCGRDAMAVIPNLNLRSMIRVIQDAVRNPT